MFDTTFGPVLDRLRLQTVHFEELSPYLSAWRAKDP
jgi:hypothetical protein